MKALQTVFGGLTLLLVIVIFHARLNAQCGYDAVTQTVNCPANCQVATVDQGQCQPGGDPTAFCFTNTTGCCALTVQGAFARQSSSCAPSCELRDHYHPRVFLVSKCKTGSLYEGEALIIADSEETLARNKTTPQSQGVIGAAQ